MKKPKLRELKEAVRAVIFGPYTSKYPAEPHEPPDGFRGRPKFDDAGCVGCGACAEVCPALAIRVRDQTPPGKPIRVIEQRWDKCVFCGQCELNCTTGEGIRLTKEYDLGTLDRSQCRQHVEYDLVLCEVCGAVVATRKHLLWIARKLGAKLYANPTLVLTADGPSRLVGQEVSRPGEPALARNDIMRIQCPACRRTTVIHELWGQ
jgi:hydrogenase-4 component H